MKVYGWYDRPDQPPDQPSYDPPHDAPCLFCGEPITAENVRTISMMPEVNPKRSYFYRVHRICHQSATENEQLGIDNVVWELIRIHGD